jgi:hypothetical protein
MSVSLGVRGLWVVVGVAVGVLLVVVFVGCVSDAVAVGSCPNEAFRVGPSAGLPDCRAYEMVSPPDKNGGGVDGGLHFGEGVPPEQAAPDGEALTYGSTSAFNEAEAASALVTSQYISRRTVGGWVTRAVTPKQELPGGKVATDPGAPDFSLFQGFSEDLSSGFLLAWNPQPDPLAPAGYFNPYLRDDETGGYELLSSVVPPDSDQSAEVTLECSTTPCGFASVYGGVSADAQHVIFQADDALTAGAVPGVDNLYEWSAGRGLELVSEPGVGGGVFGSSPSGAASLVDEAGDGGAANGFPYNFSGALSSDGKRAFWSGGRSQVYMHEITGSGSRTVMVSASQKSGEPSTSPAQYWTANRDGSLVYFISPGQLTADSTAGVGGGQDLYQYDTNTGELSDLTVDSHAGETAAVKGVLGTGESEGVPYVYFTAAGVLAGNENSEGEKAVPQTCQSPTYTEQDTVRTPCNLYVNRGGQTAFISVLGEAEDELSDVTEAVMVRTSRVSPSGRFLAFQSELPLTGYDNTPADGQPCPQPVREGIKRPYGGRCLEVFEYDAQSGGLVCVSCDRSGLPPTGDSMVPETFHGGENSLGWESSTVQQRYLLDDGRLFFQSEDALLPQATNGRLNIYEYEPEGVGQCAATGAGGCVYLISTGESSGNSYFADASSDGRDVFILTGEQLVPQDGDEAVDVYDAREDGGFSSAQPPPCAGEACKPAVTPAPAIYGAPASTAFQGAGNITAAPVAKPTKPTKPTKKTKKTKKAKRAKKTRKARKVVKQGRARRAKQRTGKRVLARRGAAKVSGGRFERGGR